MSYPPSLTNSSTMSSFLLNMLCDIAKRDFNAGPPPPPKKKPHFRGWMAPVPYPVPPASSRPSPRPRPSLPIRVNTNKTKQKTVKAKKLNDYLKPGLRRYPAVASAREKRLERRRMISGK